MPRPASFPSLLAVALALVPSTGLAGPGGSFFDDFNRFDSARWTVSDGWANGEWMDCLWSGTAAAIRDGTLVLSVEKRPAKDQDFVCGEIQSRAAFGHGTYEIAFRTARGSGLNAAFFTYTGPSHGTPHHEIDIEVLLRDPAGVSFNTYVEGRPANGRRVSLTTPSHEGTTHYAFTWREDAIVWYVDRVERHRTAPGASIPAAPQKLFASLWISDAFPRWMGPMDPDFDRKTMVIDWIAYTQAGEGCRFPASVLCPDPEHD